MGHAYCVVGEIVAADICSESSQGDAADNSLLRFAGAVAPLVVVVEATATN